MVKEEYAAVSLDLQDEDEDDTERLSAGVQRAPSLQQQQRHYSSVSPLRAFLGGLLAGAALLLGFQHVVFLPQKHSSNTNTNSGSFAVSYAFLQTQKGMDTMELLQQTLRLHGPVQTLLTAQRLIQSDDQFAASCHPVLHMVGRTALQELGMLQGFKGLLLGTDGNQNQTALLRLCNAAYLHGVMENHLLFSESETELKSRIDMIDAQVCEPMAAIELGAWECHHGMGHGILQYYRKVTTQAAIHASQAACNSLVSPKDAAAKECANGLWMDHFAATGMTAVMEASTREICDIAEHKVDCGIYTPTAFLLHRPRQYVEAVAFCSEGLEHDELVGISCIGGVGNSAAKENLNDFGPVEQACMAAPTPFLQDICINEAIDYLVFNAGVAGGFRKDLCDPLTVFKDRCLDRQSNPGLGPNSPAQP